MAQYGSMTLREREKVQKRNEEKAQDSSDAREPRKSRKLNSGARKFDRVSRAKFDEKGLDKETSLDLCDCLDDTCPGCWMDCPKCGSRKCGHECRCFRRFKYEYVEIEGTSIVIRSEGTSITIRSRK